jgi:hypothetical protein
MKYSEIKKLILNHGIEVIRPVIEQGLTDPDLIEQRLGEVWYPIEVYLAAQYLGITDVEDVYEGAWSSDEEFAEELCAGNIPDDLPSWIYIDWERTARDLMFDYWSHNNHYFRVS